MKKRSVLFLLLALLLLLTGCGLQPAADGNAAEHIPTEQNTSAAGEPVSEGAILAASRTEAMARTLTEEEILSAYDRAVAAYEWFDLTPLPTTGETRSMNGRLYYRVDYPGLENVEDLRVYLRGLFSEEVVERLLDVNGEHPPYLDIDGGLYGFLRGRERDPYAGEVRTEVEQDSNTAYSVTVAVDLLDNDRITVTGMESYVFSYEQVDGRWVFTNFQLPD